MGQIPRSKTSAPNTEHVSRRTFLKQMTGLGGGALGVWVLQACGGAPAAEVPTSGPAAAAPTAAPAAPAAEAPTSAPAAEAPTSAPAAPAEATAAPAAPAAGTPKSGGKLNWAMTG